MNDFTKELRRIIPNRLKHVTFVCIGTDRSTGDSLGPLVGTSLKRLGYHVIGTLEDPCHAENLNECLEKIPPKRKVIAIDACLGRVSSVGKLQPGIGPIKPGAGVGKDLTPVGDYHISGIVNVGGFMEYFVLQNTRLHLVMEMADQIVDAIVRIFPPAFMAEVASSKENMIEVTAI
ncbi:putative sporulation protein YyaC [Paenibacillus algorifonticola]|uniref:Putative sporulation protein YyaC n=1 Tax=Paenibacillus algorifonticola TaxID=684063 RepID=A0A1I2GYQ4_9BACL|nr:spore protease YyaC [Paenibacillus algorifonticola]SFF22552.1 putative sporulation protein YyaC [Paenibacillus algorifonticola]